MKYFVTVGEAEMEVELSSEGVRIDGQELGADLLEMDGTDLHSLLLGSTSHQVLATRNGAGEWNLHLSGYHLRTRVVDERTRAIRQMTGGSERRPGPRALKAPMPGLVVKVEVQEGETVTAGRGLVIVEAMKMENELKSDGEVRVSKVLVEPGQTVEKDQILMEFEAVDASSQGDLKE